MHSTCFFTFIPHSYSSTSTFPYSMSALFSPKPTVFHIPYFPYSPGFRSTHRYIITLWGDIPLMIFESSSFSCHLLSITSQIEEGISWEHLLPWCSIDWLNLVLAFYSHPQISWIPLCPENIVLSLTFDICNISDTFHEVP